MPRKKKTENIAEADASEEKKSLAEKAKSIVEKAKKIERDLIERAKQLEKNIEEKIKAEDVKIPEQKIDQKEGKLFFPLDDYVKAGIHLGTRVISGDMRSYVYRRRADGLAILNTNIIDKKLHEAAEFISGFKPEEIILACKREAGWLAAKKFSEVTGIRVFTKKYPVGIITNPVLQDFFEPSLIIICDPWLDKNTLADAKNLNLPVVGLCDTNNLTSNIDHVIACNNKSNKSIGLVLFLTAQEYCKKHSIPFNASVKDFIGEELEEAK